MKVNDITGIILAGGKSRRFGRDKAAYMVNGLPMIEHVYRALSTITSHVFLSIRDFDTPTTLPVPAVVDQYPGMGPLAGLHAGLAAAKTPWVLAVACDIPYVTPDVLWLLTDARSTDTAAVLARTPDGRNQPLCACYSAVIRSVVEEQLSAGRLSMSELLGLLSPVRIVEVPGAPLRNINTPSDLF